MWFKNLIVYTIPQQWNIDAAPLADRLAAHAFAPAMSLEEANVGWVAPRDGDPSLVCEVSRQWLIAFFPLPNNVVRMRMEH